MACWVQKIAIQWSRSLAQPEISISGRVLYLFFEGEIFTFSYLLSMLKCKQDHIGLLGVWDHFGRPCPVTISNFYEKIYFVDSVLVKTTEICFAKKMLVWGKRFEAPSVQSSFHELRKVGISGTPPPKKNCCGYGTRNIYSQTMYQEDWLKILVIKYRRC